MVSVSMMSRFMIATGVDDVWSRNEILISIYALFNSDRLKNYCSGFVLNPPDKQARLTGYCPWFNNIDLYASRENDIGIWDIEISSPACTYCFDPSWISSCSELYDHCFD